MSSLQNGVDVEKLAGTVNAVKADPSLAQFKFRANTEWLGGGHSKTKIQSFFGVGQEDSSRREPFVVEGDEPPVLLGTDKAPNAVEVVLAALASCLSVGFAYNAAAMGITLNSLEFTLEGDVDLHGFLGLSEEIRPGFGDIRVSCNVVSDAPREKIQALCDHVQKTSPVLDVIRNPVPVSLSLEVVTPASA